MSSVSDQDLRSVPYDSDPAGRPISVSRPVVDANISEPATTPNPTVTADGVDLTMQWAEAEGERADATTSTLTPRFSYSSTLHSDESEATTINEQPNPLASFANLRLLQNGGLSARRSSSIHGSFRPLSPIPPTPSPPPSSSSAVLSFAPSSDLPHSHGQRITDGLNLSRPGDEEIEAMFQNIVRTRDLGNLPPLTIDKKWSMVEGDERLRWKEEQAREGKARKILEQDRTGMIEEGSPEWYLRKFMERSITPKGTSDLLVSLRTNEIGCVSHCFSVSLGIPDEDSRCRRQMVTAVHRDQRDPGTCAIYLAHEPQGVCHVFLSTPITLNDSSRTEADLQLEYETLRCIKQILNTWVCLAIYCGTLPDFLSSPPHRTLVLTTLFRNLRLL